MSEVTNDGESALPSASKELLARLAGPRGMEPLAGLFVLLLLTLGTLVTDPARTQVNFGAFAIVVFRSGALAWIAFVLLGYLIGAITRHHQLARAILFIISYVATEIFRTTFLALNVFWIDPTMDINWPFRIVAGGLSGLVLFSLVAVVLNDTREYRALATKLHEAQNLILHNVNLTEREFVFRRDETLSSVRSIVETALREVASRSTSNPESVKRTVVELVHVSDNVIRPLSHEMFAMPESFLEPSSAKVRVRFFRAMELTTLEKPFRPELDFVLVFLLTIGAAFFGSPSLLVGLSQMVLLAGSVFVVMWLARRFLLSWIREQQFWLRTLVINAVYAGYSVTLGVFVSSALTKNVGSLFPLWTAIIGMSVFGFLAFIPGLQSARIEVLEELKSKNAELLWLNARLGARLWAERKGIARTLHRDVQGVLVAAAFRLERAIEKDSQVDEAVAEVHDLIELAAKFVVQPQIQPLTSVLCDQLIAQWEGVLRVDCKVKKSVRMLLDADPVGRQAFIDIVAEFLTNSVKHGRASRVNVKVDYDESSHLLVIDAHNDGDPINSPMPPIGLGSKMLDSVTLENHIANDSRGGVRLSATLPIAAAPLYR